MLFNSYVGVSEGYIIKSELLTFTGFSNSQLLGLFISWLYYLLLHTRIINASIK